MILALLLEQVKLTEAAKALLLLAVVSIVGAFIVKKVFKNYSHIKGLAEDFLKVTDVFGAVKCRESGHQPECATHLPG